MPINKPYYRVIRSFINPDSKAENYINSTIEDSYILSDLYSQDRKQLIRSYKIIEKDLIELFDYIEPCDDNLATYSQRIYELFLRCSTEFETNAKAILNANGYSKSGNFDIEDYRKIETASKLSDYEIEMYFWSPSPKRIKPFDSWKSHHSLKWYQDYNYVKHDRNREFRRANLKNLIYSAAGTFAVLFSQFCFLSFNSYQMASVIGISDDGFMYDDNFLFSVKLPNWTDEE